MPGGCSADVNSGRRNMSSEDRFFRSRDNMGPRPSCRSCYKLPDSHPPLEASRRYAGSVFRGFDLDRPLCRFLLYWQATMML